MVSTAIIVIIIFISLVVLGLIAAGVVILLRGNSTTAGTTEDNELVSNALDTLEQQNQELRESVSSQAVEIENLGVQSYARLFLSSGFTVASGATETFVNYNPSSLTENVSFVSGTGVITLLPDRMYYFRFNLLLQSFSGTSFIYCRVRDSGDTIIERQINITRYAANDRLDMHAGAIVMFPSDTEDRQTVTCEIYAETGSGFSVNSNFSSIYITSHPI